MLRQTFTAAGIALACTSALAQSPESRGAHFVRTGRAQAAPPPITLPTAPLVGGSDNCSTADVIAGGGPFAYDFTAATTGTEGQTSFLGGDCGVGCAEYGNAQVAVPQDVWFSWTAPTTGRIDVSTCGQTTDTKLAVYDGTAGCPTGTSCLGCSDDYHYAYGMLVDSRVITNVTAGQNIKIQIGASSLGVVGTTGTFTVSYLTFDQIKDDGVADDGYVYGPAGSAMFEIETFGDPAATTTVTGVSVVWGTVPFGGATNGTAAQIAIWQDPTNDGNPSDAVLLQTQNTTVQSANTDTFVTINFSPAVTVSGVYFVGVIQNVLSATDFPFAYDGNGCVSQPNTAWIGFNQTGVADITTLTNNTVPPTAMNAFCQGTAYNGQFHGDWLLRAATQGGPIQLGTPFCFGDGVAPHTACPCANNSAVADQAGCLNSLNTAGKLRGTGVASLAADSAVLQGSGMANSSVLYFQGTIQQTGGNGVAFGDGLRCAGGSVIRLGQSTNVAGASMYPAGAQSPISVKGSVTSPGTRTYQGWYRNAAAFCTPSTFNLTNGLEITWLP